MKKSKKSNSHIHSLKYFYKTLSISVFLGSSLIALALLIGMYGYHRFEGMAWIDAFASAAMILSGMGPLGPLQTFAGKIFAGCYALFSGLLFIAIVGIIFAPVVHRFFHQIHLQMLEED